MGEPRYAIYFAPDPAGALWRFGSAALGYDAATGQSIEPAPLPGLSSDERRSIIGNTRRYGFHATLKAPFSLAHGTSLDHVLAAFDAFARSRARLPVMPFHVGALGSFLALLPVSAADNAALSALADDVVDAFEAFRAPLAPEDRRRRIAQGLDARQTELLDRYGYPFTREQFRFHMTLTGRLPANRTTPLRIAFEAAFRNAVPSGMLAIDRLALFEQTSRDRAFRIIASAALA